MCGLINAAKEMARIATAAAIAERAWNAAGPEGDYVLGPAVQKIFAATMLPNELLYALWVKAKDSEAEQPKKDRMTRTEFARMCGLVTAAQEKRDAVLNAKVTAAEATAAAEGAEDASGTDAAYMQVAATEEADDGEAIDGELMMMMDEDEYDVRYVAVVMGGRGGRSTGVYGVLCARVCVVRRTKKPTAVTCADTTLGIRLAFA